MMSFIISKVSQNTSGNSKYVDRADAIERFLQQKRDAKAAQRAQASNSNKETTNKTDKQWLFIESNKSITEISIEVGFGSLTHFERVFCKNNGITPKKFCTNVRKDRDAKEKLDQATTTIVI